MAEFGKKIEKAGTKVTGIGKKIEKAGDAVGKVGKKFAPLSAAAAGTLTAVTKAHLIFRMVWQRCQPYLIRHRYPFRIIQRIPEIYRMKQEKAQ